MSEPTVTVTNKPGPKPGKERATINPLLQKFRKSNKPVYTSVSVRLTQADLEVMVKAGEERKASSPSNLFRGYLGLHPL